MFDKAVVFLTDCISKLMHIREMPGYDKCCLHHSNQVLLLVEYKIIIRAFGIAMPSL